MKSTPQDELIIEQNWTRASSKAIGNAKPFSYFSAVCWLSGKALYDSMDEKVDLTPACSLGDKTSHYRFPLDYLLVPLAALVSIHGQDQLLLLNATRPRHPHPIPPFGMP